MEVIILLLVAYAVSAPDPVTLAATRGAVGAGRAAWAHRASTRPARRSSGRGSTGAGSSGRSSASGGGSGPSSSRPPAGGRASTGSGGASTPTDTGPVEESIPTDTTASTTPSGRFAGVRAAWSGARAGAGTARARRAAGVDWTSRAARTARTVGLATAGAGVAAARAVAVGVGVGAGAVRARWATRTAPTTTPAPAAAAAGAVLVGEVIDPADPADHPAAAGTGSPVADTVAGTAGGVQDLPAPTGAGSDTDVREFLAMMQTTDLESLPEVRAEITAATTLCEELAEQIAHLQTWAEGLADRWSGTAWGTRDLDTAVADVSEAVSSLSSGEGVMEALSAAQGAVERAEQLGEVVAEHGATGDTRAFAPA